MKLSCNLVCNNSQLLECCYSLCKIRIESTGSFIFRLLLLPSPTERLFMPSLITTLGNKSADEVGMILPHEHIFVDLRTWDKPGYGTGNAADVIALMSPEVEKAKAVGVTALVECTPMGVG